MPNYEIRIQATQRSENGWTREELEGQLRYLEAKRRKLERAAADIEGAIQAVQAEIGTLKVSQ